MKALRTMVAAMALLGLAVAPAAAHEPTCTDVDFLAIEVHGQHVIRDYVIGDDGTLGSWPPAGAIGAQVAGEGVEIRGGPGPGFHFLNDVPPGASFCNPQANSDRALR